MIGLSCGGRYSPYGMLSVKEAFSSLECRRDKDEFSEVQGGVIAGAPWPFPASLTNTCPTSVAAHGPLAHDARLTESSNGEE